MVLALNVVEDAEVKLTHINSTLSRMLNCMEVREEDELGAALKRSYRQKYFLFFITHNSKNNYNVYKRSPIQWQLPSGLWQCIHVLRKL